jgi:pantetheine-phosphate adenylyltransferase
MSREAVYAVSLDPMTNGHLFVIEAGAAMFDRLTVAIADHPDKHYTFPYNQRVAMTAESCSRLPNVEVKYIGSRSVVRFARSVGAKYALRGLRSTADFEYEHAMMDVNADLAPEVQSVFLIGPPHLAKLSSSMVKGLTKLPPEDWKDVVKNYVPEPVYRRLLKSLPAPEL